jgi:hypothetical protein
VKNIFVMVSFLVAVSISAQTYVDNAFTQDYADKYVLNEGINTKLFQVNSDRNLSVEVVGTKILLQASEKELVEELKYRPLTDIHIISSEVYRDQFVYLSDNAVLSNAWAGKYYLEHGIVSPKGFAIGRDFSTLVVGGSELALFENKEKVWTENIEGLNPLEVLFDDPNNRFLIVNATSLYQFELSSNKLSKVYNGEDLTSIGLFNNKIVLGTKNGLLNVDSKSFKAEVLNQKLPWTEITSVTSIDGSLWVGSTKGAFKLREDGKYNYYASQRWLVDDVVVDVSKGPENSILILSKTGLSKINFVEMTLEEKAAYFQKIQRLRHNRYGFNSEVMLKEKGNLATTVYTDTDNDGLWTSMYLAGELFRYAVTKSEDARLNAYEAFEAMERMTEITQLDGFPARSYERDGYELGIHANGFSHEWTQKYLKENGRIWRLSEDGKWRWKSTTSSDESCGHFFVYALFAELAPDKEWRDRAIHQIKIEMDHIIRNNWYLQDWNGEPTAWGRWNPEYVNSFPINVGDRRLNSTLVISWLQTAYHYTKDEIYKEKAYELINEHGYDENANRLATVIDFVEGEDLSNTWNHSDDEMYFMTIPSFVNYSFNEAQKAKHYETAKSHWEIERSEKNPLWNYLFALSGGKDIDVEESAWWLREFPMDLVDWKIDNSHRKDLKKIEPNFRRQTYTEVLPKDERVLNLHNGAYGNDGGSGGFREYPPYIWLLPYWAGRYVEAISAPTSK